MTDNNKTPQQKAEEARIKEQLPEPPEPPPSVDTHPDELEDESPIDVSRYAVGYDLKKLYDKKTFTRRRAQLAFKLRMQRDYTLVREYETARFFVFEALERKQ